MFGEKHISVSCFFRSCIASATALALTWLGFFLLADISVGDYIASWSGVPTERVALAFSIIVFGNLFPDYLSLLETRFALTLVGRSDSLIRMVLILLLDLIVTAAIFIGALAFYNWLYYGSLGQSSGFVAELRHHAEFFLSWTFAPHVDLHLTDTLENATQYVTTFFTSIWLWLFTAGTIVMKTADRVGGRPWIWVRDELLDLETKPILSLGFVVSACVLGGFAVMAPLFVSW